MENENPDFKQETNAESNESSEKDIPSEPIFLNSDPMPKDDFASKRKTKLPISSSLIPTPINKTPRGDQHQNLVDLPTASLTSRKIETKDEDLDYDNDTGSEDDPGDTAIIDRESIKQLRRSVEGTIQEMMDKNAETAELNPPEEPENEIEPVNQEGGTTDNSNELENDGELFDYQSALLNLDKNFLITQVQQVIEGHDADEIQPNQSDISIPPLDFTPEEPKPPQQPLFTEQDVENAFKEYQKSKKVPPAYMRDAVVIYVHAITNEAIEAEDYDLAEKLDKTLKELIAAFNKTYGINNSNANMGDASSTSDSSANLKQRLEEKKLSRQAAVAEWEEKIQTLKESEQKKIEEIQQRQQVEREEFESKCQTPEFLQKFTKPSARLLQLWKLQKGLALQHDFEGAKELKQKAAELQKIETAEAQQRAINSVKVNYEKLVMKQRRELDCAIANGQRKIVQLEQEMKRDLETRDKISKQMEVKIKEWRRPLKKSCLPPLNSNSPSQNQYIPNSLLEENSTVQRDITTSALSKRVVASGAKKSRAKSKMEPSAVLDVKITNIRSVLGKTKY